MPGLKACGICPWQTTRPERYAQSAQDAHAIQHRRGLR